MKPPWPATATRWAPPVHLRPFALRHGACYRAVASQAATTDDGTPPKVDSSNLYNHFITRAPDPEQPNDGTSGTAAAASSRNPALRLAVKDNIATRGLPMTCGSAVLGVSYRSWDDAGVVASLRRRLNRTRPHARWAGLRVVGKTNLDEFGMGSQSVHSAFGPVRSPYGGGDTSRSEATAYSAGGSSGGSAVAVAVGDADVALGTDTGGSVRLPAAYTGVVGFKPSYGMISRRGVVPYANSLDTVGLLARDVETIEELIVGGCAGVAEDDGGGNNANRAGVGDDEVWRDGLWNENDPLDPTSLTPATRLRCARVRMGYRCGESSCRDGNAEEWKNGIRYDAVTDRNDVRLDRVVFGLPLEYNVAELDPRIRDAWRRTAELLQRELGCSVVPVSLPWTRHALSAYYIIAPAEASSNLAKYDGVRYGLRESGAEGGHGAGEGTRGAGRVGDSGQLYAATRGRGLGAEVRRRILLGAYSLSASARHNYFVRAQRVRRLVRRDFDAAFRLGNPLVDSDEGESETRFKEDKAADAQQHYDLSDLHVAVPLHDKHGPVQVDFLLCPTAPTLPPRLRDIARQNPVESYTNDVFTVPASLAGLPAISIPVDLDIGAAGHGADAVNGAFNFAGMQLIGQFWDDARLLAVARTLAPLLRRETR